LQVALDLIDLTGGPMPAAEGFSMGEHAAA